MFNLQVTLSDFQCRKRQFQLREDFLIVFRFGSIKLDIKISSNYGQFIGGKRIVLDISPQQLQQMFLTYALGMFLQNNSGKFFSLLSLQNLHYSDIVSGQEVYFHNDSQEIVYSANFSIVFNDFKNPRQPNNKGAIENYKTFDQMFKKPAVPTAQDSRQQLGKTTMSSFLYGNSQNQNGNGLKSTINRPASGKPKKSTSVKGQHNNKNMAKTATSQFQKQKYGATINNPVPQMAQTSYSQQNINIYRPFEQQDYQQTDINPPMMQFTNTITDPQKGLGLLKTQLQQLSSAQGVKLMTAFEAKNGISRQISKNIVNKDAKNARIKIQQQFMKTKNNSRNLGYSREIDNNLTTNSNKQSSSMMMKVDRQQLRNKAKQQLSSYQGNTNIKIPILKDGKYEFVQLSQLSEEEIKKFAQKQKQLQFEEEMRRQMQRQLQKKEKQNERLKRQLQEKQRLMKKRQYQAKRQKQQLSKKQQQQQLKYNQQQQQTKKLQQQQSQSDQQSQNQQNNYEDDSELNYDDSQMNQQSPQRKEQKHSPKYQPSNQQQEQNYYESDFESMASGLKQSKNSINSSQKLKGQQSYNQSYDPDFQSYSQSFLDSKLKLSASEISDSNYYEYKKK